MRRLISIVAVCAVLQWVRVRCGLKRLRPTDPTSCSS